MSSRTVTPGEIAKSLGISPKSLRAWLRSEAGAGNPLVKAHLRYERWQFNGSDAQELAGQYRRSHQASFHGA